MVFPYNNQGNSFHATIIGSKIGVDLEVVFLKSLQSTLLKANAKSLGLLKTYAAMMRRPRCSSVKITDDRPGCGHDVEVVMMRMCLDDLLSKMRFVGHEPRLCDWSHSAKVMWLIGFMTMILQLPSFLDANSIEHVVVCWRRNCKWESGKKPSNQWVGLRRKIRRQIRTF